MNAHSTDEPHTGALSHQMHADYMVSMDPITTLNALGDDGLETGVSVGHYMASDLHASIIAHCCGHYALSVDTASMGGAYINT